MLENAVGKNCIWQKKNSAHALNKMNLMPSSLSDLKNRGENSAGRGQILSILQINSRSIDQKSGEIWTAHADLQPISFKSESC